MTRHFDTRAALFQLENPSFRHVISSKISFFGTSLWHVTSSKSQKNLKKRYAIW